MDKFADIEALTAVVEAGSFSAAGERLGVAKSVVSRRVSQLEARLGSRLLHRTTRRLSLTDTGQHFYQRAVQILADLDDAEQSVSDEVSGLRGVIKLAAPLSFGLCHLQGALVDFLDAHPAIELNLDLNDRNINLVEEGFDMAVRVGELENSTLVARRIGTMRSITCASAGYLKQHGIPTHPADLQQHIGLQYSNVSYKNQWQYEDSKGKKFYGQPQIRIRANNGEALAAAAIAGLGITAGPSFILGRYIRDGQLTPLLDEFQFRRTGIYAVYPPGRLVPRRITLFTDFLAARFGDDPYWDEGLESSSR